MLAHVLTLIQWLNNAGACIDVNMQWLNNAGTCIDVNATT